MDKVFSQLYNYLHDASHKNTDPLENFFFSTKQNVILMFYIASQKDKQATLEGICYNISPKVVSRSTVQNILKEGVRINFLKKKINEKDKRSKNYTLTKEAISLMEEWVYLQKEVFSKIDRTTK
tara:strand:+ start:1003 stop:1374 length:372 start_codon:yes stop_codon:yes gene_type:complete